MKVIGNVIRNMVKASYFSQTEHYMMVNGYKEKLMEKERSLMQTKMYMKGSGGLDKKMVMEFMLFILVRNMKECGKKMKNVVREHSSSEIRTNILVNFQMGNKTVKVTIVIIY